MVGYRPVVRSAGRRDAGAFPVYRECSPTCWSGSDRERKGKRNDIERGGGLRIGSTSRFFISIFNWKYPR